MNVQNTQTLLSTLIQASEHQTYVPLVLWGEAGVSKSQTVAQAAKREGIGFVDLRLGTQEAGDLMGLPEIRDGRTHYAAPTWWPEPGTRGILFLDEMNRSHRDIRGAVFQLILDRMLMTHKLPAGWVIVAACNPASEDYEVDDSYDKAFMARFCHIALQPTADEWKTWAKGAGVHWSVIAMADMHPGMMGLDGCTLPKVHPTPRTWTMLATLMDAGLPAELQMEVAAGLVGAEQATVWGQVLESQERPVDALDALCTTQGLERLTKHTAEGRIDLVQGTMDAIVELTRSAAWNADAHFPGLVKVITTAVPADLGFRYLKLEFVTNNNLIDLFGSNMDLVEWAESVAKAAAQ